jgi:oligopeptide/dipeptide ABC transporter ATP-binding protein
MNDIPLLQVQALRKLFPVKQTGFGRDARRQVHAVDGVSFDLDRGEVLALVGESGCGKSTLALTLMGLEPPTAGRILFEGRDVSNLPTKEQKHLRQRIQMVFQDPYESLNPLMTIGEIVAEPLQVHRLATDNRERAVRVRNALEDAGLRPAAEYLHRYPHQLSGGQRQRVVIAGALVLEPVLLLADEPVSMLDVSIRAEILTLLAELRASRSISILFITHDLATAAHFTDRVAVMYLGRIVEMGPTRQVLSHPTHPYTKALLSVIPVPNPRLRQERIILQGDPPNPVDLPPGCRFHPRCPAAQAICRQQDPALHGVAEAHQAACLLL